jgi:hypothetical protein
VVGLVGLPSAGSAQGAPGNVIVYLDPMTREGVGGTVNLAPHGQATNFEVKLKSDEKAEGRGAYKVRVVEGSCSTPGDVVEDLNEVRADGKTSREDGNLRLSDVRRGDRVIQVAAKHGKRVVACGMIPSNR